VVDVVIMAGVVTCVYAYITTVVVLCMVAVVTLAYVDFALDAVDVAESHLKVIIDDRKGPETFSISIIKAIHHEYRHGGTTI
jgi:hypothetical protein